MGQKITKPRTAKDMELRKVVDKSKEVKGYYYLHESDCGGSIVALLPFRFGNGNRIEYLVRRELIPCWDMDRMCIAAITGTANNLWEKTGFLVNPMSKRFKALGACFGSKRSDTVYSLFAVNVHGLASIPALGDGSAADDISTCYWMVDSAIGMAVDPLVYILHYRTSRYIRRIANPRQTAGNSSKAVQQLTGKG